MVNSHNQTLPVYNDLEAIGLGLKKLKLLWHTIKEIATANNIVDEEAANKFFKDINEHYDDKLGFESKIDELQAKVNRLNRECNRLRAELLLYPRIGLVLIQRIMLLEYGRLMKVQNELSRDSQINNHNRISERNLD